MEFAAASARWDLVIFDCDGVLVDSEPLSNRVLMEMLGEIGLPMSYEETVRNFVGRSNQATMERIAELLGRPAPAGFLREFLRRATTAFGSELRATPGVAAVLEGLAIPTCVASSADRETVQTALEVTGLRSSFGERIFSARQVARGKPYPDVFLYAAQQMGAEPARCAVIEDSLVGVQAGLAAGMTVFGYVGTCSAEVLQAAGAIAFEDMAMLPGLLAGDAYG